VITATIRIPAPHLGRPPRGSSGGAAPRSAGGPSRTPTPARMGPRAAAPRAPLLPLRRRTGGARGSHTRRSSARGAGPCRGSALRGRGSARAGRRRSRSRPRDVAREPGEAVLLVREHHLLRVHAEPRPLPGVRPASIVTSRLPAAGSLVARSPSVALRHPERARVQRGCCTGRAAMP
jgi:hypothetical protein